MAILCGGGGRLFSIVVVLLSWWMVVMSAAAAWSTMDSPTHPWRNPVRKWMMTIAEDMPTNRRRSLLHRGSIIVGGSVVPFWNSQRSITAAAVDHRQVELCVVTLLRVVYWAQYELQQIDTVLSSTTNDDNDRQRAVYLETRLGAKAALTGRITGSGATNRVYQLTTLQLSGCLKDLEWYGDKNGRNRVVDMCQSFREGLASIVEFDGLDTLTDPSPRSALTMSQYNVNKLKLIRRTLNERIIPDGQTLVAAFGPDVYQRSYGYVQQYYSDEIPIRPSSIENQSEDGK